ncbi:hypothetical protein ACFX2I_032955 [Malus domestica]
MLGRSRIGLFAQRDKILEEPTARPPDGVRARQGHHLYLREAFGDELLPKFGERGIWARQFHGGGGIGCQRILLAKLDFPSWPAHDHDHFSSYHDQNVRVGHDAQVDILELGLCSIDNLESVE